MYAYILGRISYFYHELYTANLMVSGINLQIGQEEDTGCGGIGLEKHKQDVCRLSSVSNMIENTDDHDEHWST